MLKYILKFLNVFLEFLAQDTVRTGNHHKSSLPQNTRKKVPVLKTSYIPAGNAFHKSRKYLSTIKIYRKNLIYEEFYMNI